MGLKAAANPDMKFPRKDTKSLTGMLSTLALVIAVTSQRYRAEESSVYLAG
jgi:hypothetical protein